ncbi:MAG: preQ(1) synthase [Armatimonadota bacterium]|nr:preQ(1) synthase [Armatimonadota bacterium]
MTLAESKTGLEETKPQERRYDIQGPETIDAGRLETFPYEYVGRDIVVEIETDEFTAVCPWSGLPDFGRLKVRYLPKEKILELKSLKYYLHSYRNVGIYQEHAANRILEDLVRVTEPKWMEIELDYNIRGGIHTVVRARWPQD